MHPKSGQRPNSLEVSKFMLLNTAREWLSNYGGLGWVELSAALGVQLRRTSAIRM